MDIHVCLPIIRRSLHFVMFFLVLYHSVHPRAPITLQMIIMELGVDDALHANDHQIIHDY